MIEYCFDFIGFDNAKLQLYLSLTNLIVFIFYKGDIMELNGVAHERSEILYLGIIVETIGLIF